MQSNIMIVEDEYITAMDMQKDLEKFGYSVAGITSSGEEAVEMAKILTPSLILMDIALDGRISGTDAAQQIINSMAVPIVFVTSYNDQDTFSRAKKVNPYGYLTKPFDNRDLGIAVELALYKFKLEVETMSETIRVSNEFLANMSHEFCTPLNGVIGFSQILENENFSTFTDKQREYIRDIVSCSKQLLSISNDVIDLAKISAGHLDFHPEKINLNMLIEDIIKTVNIFLIEKNIKFELNINQSLPDITIDPLRFKQILFNYLTNAIKFSKQDGKITLSIQPENENNFRVTVIDDGLGIQQDDLKKIFQPFSQINLTANKEYQGTELGLAIVKRLVEAQGGLAGVDSVYSKGSSFYIVLPYNLLSNKK